MNNPNIGWLFYKAYYNNPQIVWKEKSESDQKANAAVFVNINDKIFQQTLPDVLPYHYPEDAGLNKEGFKTFELQTTYPGLLTGTGYTHGTNLMGEIKLGFYFDHTTGLPIIPGSSVKGMLRSLFPMQDQQRAAKCLREADSNKRNKEKSVEIHDLLEKSKQYDELSMQKENFIRSFLPDDYQHIDVFELERQIFGTNSSDKNDKSAENDVFHDAILVKSLHPAKDKNSPNRFFLGEDYITPHKNTKDDGIPNALKNPQVLSMIKVLPAVIFRFQFQLQDQYCIRNKEGKIMKIPFLLTAQQRADLFRSILTTIGIGAKTNVGYGQFTETNK